MALWGLFGRSKRKPGPPPRDGFSTSLQGYYELRGDRVVGSLTDDYELPDDGMQVEFIRQGHVIASCPATWTAKHKRYDFLLPIEGRFNGADLVRETVIVVARSSEGKRGRVLLDGAAQLEMVRDYMAIPSVTVLDLDFTRGGNAQSCLGAGWSGAEANFTWSEDDDSIITFDTPDRSGTYALRLTVSPHLRPPELPEQELTIFVDDTPVATVIYTGNYTQFNEMKFRSDAFGTGPRTTMRLHHPNAACPSDFGASDTRRLAIAFKRLTLAYLLDSEHD